MQLFIKEFFSREKNYQIKLRELERWLSTVESESLLMIRLGKPGPWVRIPASPPTKKWGVFEEETEVYQYKPTEISATPAIRPRSEINARERAVGEL